MVTHVELPLMMTNRKRDPPPTGAQATKHSNKYICDPVILLSYHRAEDCYNWVDVEGCLRNIHEILLSVSKEFSQGSPNPFLKSFYKEA